MKINSVAVIALIAPLLSTSVLASNIQPFSSNFYIGASAGYGVVNNMLSNDGQSPIGRLTLGYKFYCYQWNNYYGNINVELGVQNGKTMRHAPAFNDPTSDLDLPIVTTLNPVLDLLLGFNLQLSPQSNFYGILKVGAAYRQLQFIFGNFINGKDQFSPEVQLGLGYTLSQHSRITVYYQGIYADGNVGYQGNADGQVSVNNIPTQQAGFVGFETEL